METLRSDLQKVVQGCVELNGKVGPLQVPSWRFPEKLAASVNVEESLKEIPVAANGHVFLLELIVDRLLFLVQNLTELLESTSSTTSHRTSPPALTLGSAVRRVIKCALKQSSKIKALKEEIAASQTIIKARQHPYGDHAPYKGLADKSKMVEEEDTTTTSTITGGEGNPHTNAFSHQAVTVASCSTQTTSTSFVLCNKCVVTHQTLMESVSLVADECSKLKLRSELGSTDWTAMVKLGDLDLAKWRSSLGTDMESLRNCRARLQDTVGMLTAERNGLGSKVDSMDAENSQLLEEVASLKDAITETKTNNEAEITEITTNFSRTIENLTNIRGDLENANKELQTKLAASREEIGQLSSSLANLKAHCHQVESELSQARDREEELERMRTTAEEQILLLTSKMNMIHDVLDHQQVELKKSKVYIESLEEKQKTSKKKQLALLTQLDELDQECTALREEAAQIRVQKQKLQEEVDGLLKSNKELQIQYQDKDEKLTQSIVEQKDLSVQLASVRASLDETEHQLELEKTNCRLLMDFPYVRPSDSNYSDHIAALVGKRLSQKQINANTVRIYLLEEQNSDLRYLNLKEAIKKKAENMMHREKKDVKKPIRLWQSNVVDELEKNWKDSDDMLVATTSPSLGDASRHSYATTKSAMFTARYPTPARTPDTWAEKRPDSANPSRASSFKGNIGHLMKAIDLHRIQSYTVLGSHPSMPSPCVKLSTGGNPAEIDVQESMDKLSVCVTCDKMCYEDASGFCANCGSRCRSAN